MPTTNVTLRMPNGQEITLDNAGSNRPDLWSYTFFIDSPSGVYELILASGDSQQTRQISVIGAPRIYASDRNGNLEHTFLTSRDALITYADFQSGREAAVILYRVVETLTPDVFSPNALTELNRWTFTPGDQPSHERLSQRISASIGPAYGTFVLLACYLDECNQLPRVSVSSRRVIWPQMVLGSVYVEPDASVLTLPNTFETIRFAPGAIDDLFDLTLSDTGVAGYLLTASAGQRMRVEFDTPNVQAYVLDPSGDILLPTGQGLGVWEFTLAQSSQHRLILYGAEDGHMTVTIPPGTAGPVPLPTATPTPQPSTSNDFPNRANALGRAST
jgi:hypothetical protein